MFVRAGSDTAPRTARPRAVGLDPGLPVLLLRTDRNLFHHGTLAVIRSLGRAGVPVHAVLEGHANPSSRSRYLFRAHPWGPPADRPDDLLAHLRAIGERIGRAALLVPMDDAGAIFVAEHADGLGNHFVFPRQDPAAPRAAADKALLLEACHRYGVPCPRSLTPESAADVDEAAAALGLPLIAKWARPWRLRPGMCSTALVHTLGELHRLFAATRDHPPDRVAGGALLRSTGDPTLGGPIPGGPTRGDGPAGGACGACGGAGGGPGPLILQRRIPPAGGDWFFHGYFDESGELLYGGVGRKHLARPPQAGHTVAGEWVAAPELERLAVRIVRLLGCRGLVDLDFRLDAVSGEYHLLDFNPRIGAQFRLFTDRNGLDLARVLHLHQSGRPVPEARPAPGRRLLVENHYLARSARRPRAGTPPRPDTPPPGTSPRPDTSPPPGAPPRPGSPPRSGTPPRPGSPPRSGTPPRPGSPPCSGTPPRPRLRPPRPLRETLRSLRETLRSLRETLRPLRETLRPLREADEFAWYAGDDLPPFLAMGKRSALRAVERLRAR
ncbi:ATP-grasp domain-containing protein [Actinomadura sp. WMMA1423]|uniref:ATP-grasp domain-containing protein n=1 Tax=Actinomadura sp. WMMA1423 TaxID=2591108 RepID=UPI0011473AEF|nr:ATP-grasp domain-containing protein [Actinomadura sp. WMMA1423]